MNIPIVPMTLGDIFEKTFSLVGKTFVRNILVALIFLAIPIVLLVFAASDFYSSIADMQDTIRQGAFESGFDIILSILSMMAFFFFAVLLLSLATLFAEIAISIIVSQEILSKPVSFTDAIVETFNLKWLYGIGQEVLKGLILIGGIIVFGIVLTIFALLSKLLMGIMAVVCLLAFIPVLIFFIFKWYFSLTVIAVEDLGVIDSMKRSWNLMEGEWWRTFWIIFLFSLLIQFVISIVSLPIQFGSMWDVYKDFFTMLGKTGGRIGTEDLGQFQRSIGSGIGIGTGISALLSLLITPVYTVVLYYDLRSRKNEFQGSEQITSTIQESSPKPLDLDSL